MNYYVGRCPRCGAVRTCCSANSDRLALNLEGMRDDGLRVEEVRDSPALQDHEPECSLGDGQRGSNGDRLAEIRARLEAIDGPWEAHGRTIIDLGNDLEVAECRIPTTPPHDLFDGRTAAFIAHAPADIAFLLAEVERLTGEAEALQKQLESLPTKLNDALLAVDRLTQERDARHRRGRECWRP